MPTPTSSPTPARPLLELQAVRKSHRSAAAIAVAVLHGIDLAIQAGELCALLGPSGSGKSSLLNLIGLLEPPSSGEIWLEGRATSALSERQRTALRGSRIGFIFQFHHLLPAFSALENVLMPAAIAHGVASPTERERALQLLERVGLAGHLHKRPAQLSGGQQQRVAIARALLLQPSLLLADEPTGNLDSRAAQDVFALLREFNAQAPEGQRSACLIVTHDKALAAQCDRQLQMQDGRLLD